MEPPIRHVRFFNQQFLKQEEFREEQTYNIHMRRRVNYALFDDGVVQITPADLTLEAAGGTQVRIKRGMAVGSNQVVFEAREIILPADALRDIATVVGAGQTAWVTVNYSEAEGAPVPVGAVTENSRVDETAEIQLHSADPSGTLTPDGDPLIVLGSVDFDTMAVDNATSRQTAQIRAALGGSGGGGSPVTVTGISPTTGTPGGPAISAVISGTGLAGATSVVFSGSGVTAAIQPGGTATSINVDITITAGAAPGARTITVASPQGTASGGAGVNFTVAAPAIPNINSFAPTVAFVGNPVTISGTNLRNAADAVGTIVRFVDPANPATVFATAAAPTFLPSLGGLQRIQIVVPSAAQFTPAPAPPEDRLCRIQVEFGGQTEPPDPTLR